MKIYLVVYEDSFYYNASILRAAKGTEEYNIEYAGYLYGSSGEFSLWNGKEQHYFSRLRSFTVEAESKLDAYNKAKASFKGSQQVVHIEELD